MDAVSTTLEKMTDSNSAKPVNCTSIFLSREREVLQKTFLKGLGLEV